ADSSAQSQADGGRHESRCCRRPMPRGSYDPWVRCKYCRADYRDRVGLEDCRRSWDGVRAVACFSLLHRRDVLVLHSYFSRFVLFSSPEGRTGFTCLLSPRWYLASCTCT